MSYYNVLFLFPLTQALLKDEAATHTEHCSYTLTSDHLVIPMHCVLAVVEYTKLVWLHLVWKRKIFLFPPLPSM